MTDTDRRTAAVDEHRPLTREIALDDRKLSEWYRDHDRALVEAVVTDLIRKLHRSFRGRGLALWEIEAAIREALQEPFAAPAASAPAGEEE